MGWTELAALHEEITITKTGDLVTSVVIDGLKGTEETPIALDAEWDEIDGGGAAAPLSVVDCAWLNISNVLAHDSDENVVLVDNSNHIALANALMWNANVDTNRYVFTTDTQCTYVSLTDCAAWGTGRKQYQIYYGDDCSITRCWGRWEATNYDSSTPRVCFAPAYNSFRCAVSYCIGVQAAAPAAGTMAGIFAGDNMAGQANAESEATVSNCLAISDLTASAFAVGLQGPTFTSCVNATKPGKSTADRRLIWGIRSQWQSSTILDKMLQYAGVNVLGELDALLRLSASGRPAQTRKHTILVPSVSGTRGTDPNVWLTAGRRTSSGVITDGSGNGRHAVPVGVNLAERWTPSGILHDGAHTRLVVPTGGELATNGSGKGNPFTLLVRVKISQPVVSSTSLELLCEANDGNDNPLATLFMASNGVPYFYMRNDAGTSYQRTGSASIKDGAEHTVAGVYDNGNIKLYVDGSLAGNLTPWASWVATFNTTRIGARGQAADTRFMEGHVLEAGRYASALDATEIAAWHAGTWKAGAAGKWVMTQPGLDTAVADTAAVGCWASRVGRLAANQITAANCPVYDAAKNSVVFDGTNDCLSCRDPFLIGTSGHVVVRVKTDANDAEQIIVSQSDEATNTRYLQLGISADNKIHYKFNNNGTADELKGGTSLGTGWRTLEWASNGTAVTLYVDGVAETITEVGGGNNGQWFGDVPDSDNCVVGAKTTSDGDAGFLNGEIGELIGFERQIGTMARGRLQANMAAQWPAA